MSAKDFKEIKVDIKEINSEVVDAMDKHGAYDVVRASKIYHKDKDRLFSPQWNMLGQMLFRMMRKKDVDYSGKKYKNLLDVGCGTGRFFSLYSCEKLSALDYSMEMLLFARQRFDEVRVLSKQNNIKSSIDEVEYILSCAVDFCSKEENFNKFDFVFSAATLSTNMKSLDFHNLISLLPQVGIDGARYVLDINLEDNIDEIKKLTTTVEGLLKNKQIKKYKILSRSSSIVIPDNGGAPHTLLLMQK